MSTEPIALWLAGDLKSAVQEYPQISEDEPGGYCRQEDQLMDAAADELRRLHEANQAMLDALKWIADQTYDPWTNGAEAQRHAISAIAKATGEQP